MNIIEELFYGNINPFERQFDHDGAYAKLAANITEDEQKLTAFLEGNDEKKQQLERLLNEQNTILEYIERQRFIEGFRLGAQLMLDGAVTPRRTVIQEVI